MLKPKAVILRVNLWKLFYEVNSNNEIPKFGLNFIVNNNYNKNFLLLCGFENFKNFFVRVDILEKLFISILDKTIKRKFTINAEMMNLLGCSKENFYKLMSLMSYKKDKDENTYVFAGDMKTNKKNFKDLKDTKKTNPFSKLLSLNIK